MFSIVDHRKRLFKGQFTTAQVGELERRRREDRGAEGVGCGPVGRGLCPLPPLRKISDFGSQYGVFSCILDGIFYRSATCLTRKTVVIWCLHCPSPFFKFFFRFKKDLVHFLAFWRRQKFHAAGPVLVRPSECITLYLGLIVRRLHRFSIVHRPSDKHVGISSDNILHSSCRSSSGA